MVHYVKTRNEHKSKRVYTTVTVIRKVTRYAVFTCGAQTERSRYGINMRAFDTTDESVRFSPPSKFGFIYKSIPFLPGCVRYKIGSLPFV